MEKEIKDNVYRLFRMAAKLNLYITSCEPDNKRILKVIEEMEDLLREIYKSSNNVI